jgi:hypothetical protein
LWLQSLLGRQGKLVRELSNLWPMEEENSQKELGAIQEFKKNIGLEIKDYLGE